MIFLITLCRAIVTLITQTANVLIGLNKPRSNYRFFVFLASAGPALKLRYFEFASKLRSSLAGRVTLNHAYRVM